MLTVTSIMRNIRLGMVWKDTFESDDGKYHNYTTVVVNAGYTVWTLGIAEGTWSVIQYDRTITDVSSSFSENNQIVTFAQIAGNTTEPKVLKPEQYSFTGSVDGYGGYVKFVWDLPDFAQSAFSDTWLDIACTAELWFSAGGKGVHGAYDLVRIEVDVTSWLVDSAVKWLGNYVLDTRVIAWPALDEAVHRHHVHAAFSLVGRLVKSRLPHIDMVLYVRTQNKAISQPSGVDCGGNVTISGLAVHLAGKVTIRPQFIQTDL